jgi:hypothetical protein
LQKSKLFDKTVVLFYVSYMTEKQTHSWFSPTSVSKSHHRHKSRYPHSFRGDDRELLSRGAHTKTAIKFTLQFPCAAHQQAGAVVRLFSKPASSNADDGEHSN